MDAKCHRSLQALRFPRCTGFPGTGIDAPKPQGLIWTLNKNTALSQLIASYKHGRVSDCFFLLMGRQYGISDKPSL
jgi:hypothetical protein